MTGDRLTLEPASAVAVGHCLAARLRRPLLDAPATNDHPRPCAWEDFTREELSHMLADFGVEAGYDQRWERYRHVDAERFHALPRSEQSRRVHHAQYPEETR